MLGGNGQAKTEFFDLLDSELAQKCRFVEKLSFSTSKDEIYKKIIHNNQCPALRPALSNGNFSRIAIGASMAQR